MSNADSPSGVIVAAPVWQAGEFRMTDQMGGVGGIDDFCVDYSPNTSFCRFR